MFASIAVRAATLTVGSLALVALIAPAASAGTSASWPQFGDDAAHSGVNTSESAIGAGNVSTLKPAFTASLPGTADGPAVYRAGVSTATGTQDLLFTTTKDGRITASDAQVWTHQNGPGNCRINNGGSACYTTSSPAIDPNAQFVYSYGLDGKVHKYATGSGDETTTGGWPQVTTLKPFDEKGSSALAIATSKGVPYLYVANGGYPGARGDYQGHVTTIDLLTGTQKVFNTICSDKTIHLTTAPATDCTEVQSAVWARPGVVYDAGTDKVYLATGNSTFDGRHNFGDSVLQLDPNGTGANAAPTDSYTPSNEAALDTYDLDLGGTAPAVLHAPAGSKLPHIAVQSGKDAKLRLLNLDNLSGQGGPGRLGGEVQLTDVPQWGGPHPTGRVGRPGRQLVGLRLQRQRNLRAQGRRDQRNTLARSPVDGPHRRHLARAGQRSALLPHRQRGPCPESHHRCAAVDRQRQHRTALAEPDSRERLPVLPGWQRQAARLHAQRAAAGVR